MEDILLSLLEEQAVQYLLLFFLLIMLGRILLFLGQRWKEHLILKKLSQSGIQDIDRMDGLQFEVYLKSLLKELGYTSEVTKASQDFGADLVMKKDRQRIVIQAKRYKANSNVSIDAVQQVYAAIPYYKANEAWVMTNSHFTKSAKKLADACDVKLYDRLALVSFINEVNPLVQAETIYKEVEPAARKCPVCAASLVKRMNKQGEPFFGCENYPTCNHTEPFAIDKK